MPAKKFTPVWLAATLVAVFILCAGATSVQAQGAAPADRGLPGCPGPVEAEDGLDVPCIALISFDESTSSKPGRNNVVLGGATPTNGPFCLLPLWGVNHHPF